MSPTEVIRQELSQSMRKIKCVRRDVVMGWLQAAGVNPWRAGQSLNECQRRSLAKQLTRFWKNA
jgi:hypothetical protein